MYQHVKSTSNKIFKISVKNKQTKKSVVIHLKKPINQLLEGLNTVVSKYD